MTKKQWSKLPEVEERFKDFKKRAKTEDMEESMTKRTTHPGLEKLEKDYREFRADFNIPSAEYLISKGAQIIKTTEGDMIMEHEIKDEESAEEESTTERILNSIFNKGLSIVDKVLDRIDKKLDDDEFMKKIEDNIVVNIEEVNWKVIAKEDKEKAK